MEETGSRNVVKRKNKFLSRFLVTLCIVFVVSVVSLAVFRLSYVVFKSDSSVYLMKKKWAEYDYPAVYEISSNIIKKEAFNNTARIYNGYSGFFLALSETDSMLALEYLDNSIISLRIALENASKKTVPQINYMLGKLYYYKNVFSGYYYYADLAVKYLTEARILGYKDFNDIPEYLGLSYAALGMTKESVQSFTEALLVRETDFLLLSIAEQYFKNDQTKLAEAYLFRISTDCKDENIVFKARLLLADIYYSEGKIDEALKEVNSVLEIDDLNADAHYKLGLIKEKQGDVVKARSEWRRTIKIDPTHQGALKKIADYK